MTAMDGGQQPSTIAVTQSSGGAPQPQNASPLSQEGRQFPNAIPDSLLASAKDSRYIKECQTLLLQIMSSVLPRRRHQLLEQESWIMASLLCLAVGLRQTPKGTTLGMETLGLQFPSRVSRWKFILATLGCFSWAYAFSPERIAMSDLAPNTLVNEDNDFSRSSPSQSNSGRGRTQQNDEFLRGNSRRQFHEAQQQAMLRRANLAADSNQDPNRNGTATSQISSNDGLQRDNNTNTQVTIGRKIREILYKAAQTLSAATLSPSVGPHTTAGESHHHQNNQQQLPLSSIQDVGRWLAKLQFAHFCLTGRFPTWIHRLSGHSLVGAEHSRLYYSPTTARLVGLLIGAQAVTALVQAASSKLSYSLVRRRQTQVPVLPTTPTVVFSNEGTEHSSSDENAKEGIGLCSICRMERTYRAAPSSCGHVACWRCLIQWVSTIRPECPLCRAACQPQDIIALHNYEPNR